MTPDPSQALVLGLVPGMGHFYTSRPLMGGLTLTTAGMAVVAGLSFQNITVVCLNEVSAGGACPAGEVVRELNERPYFWIGVGVAAAVTVAGAIDAYLAAKNQRDAFTAITQPTESVTLEAGMPRVSARDAQLDFSFLRLRFR